MKCAPGTDTLRPGFTRCASGGGTCTFTGTCAVAYGAGTYTYMTATGSTACTSASFGGAPAATIMKSCSVAPVGNPAGGWAGQRLPLARRPRHGTYPPGPGPEMQSWFSCRPTAGTDHRIHDEQNAAIAAYIRLRNSRSEPKSGFAPAA